MIFEKWRIGSMSLGNRIMRSGTSEFAADSNGCPNEHLARLYTTMARGGASLIVTGYTFIREDGRSDIDQNGIHTNEVVPAWHAITDAVHAAAPDCKIAMQLVHGGRQCKPDSVTDTLAPSAVHDPRAGITPRQMTVAEIWQMIETFGQAAARVKQAGFDALQLHAAHGYLLSQFISPHTNRRTDAWGGNTRKRARFFVEVLKRCRQELGEDFPILAKLNCTDFLPTGITPEEAGEIGSILADESLQGIEISAWMYEAEPELSPSRKVDPKPEEEGYFLNQARIVRRIVPASVPVGLCGGIRSLAAMSRLLDDEGLDFISMSRPFIAEPDLSNRLKAGQPRTACDSCNECLESERHPIVSCPPLREGRLYERIGHPEWV